LQYLISFLLYSKLQRMRVEGIYININVNVSVNIDNNINNHVNVNVNVSQLPVLVCYKSHILQRLAVL
jgi:hypothetical protein